ncbi:hypothetical protein [Gordonia sp. CPCC 205333]|uniref:hypothetical protein n=1 Tax=Gordonia sp. CPCC 205333 TaxID=3140790 RepID=UPI003AF367DC
MAVYGGNQAGQYPNIDQRIPGVGYVIANLPLGAKGWTGTLKWRDILTGRSGSAGPSTQGPTGVNAIDFPQLRTGPGLKAVTVKVTSDKGQAFSCSGRLYVF